MSFEAESANRNSPEAIAAKFDRLDPKVKEMLDQELNRINMGLEIFEKEFLGMISQQERRELLAIIADLHLHKDDKEIIKESAKKIKDVVS